MIKNFPPFYPIIYHDINLDIPPQHQSLCKAAYRSWLYFICLGVLVDLICSLVIISSLSTEYLSYFWFKLLYSFVIPPTAFFCLYFSLYNALKQNDKLYWILHAFSAVTWIVYLLMSMIGSAGIGFGSAFPGGESGFASVLYYFGMEAYVAAVAALVVRLWWLAALVFYIIQTRKVFQTYSAAQSAQDNKKHESAELGTIDRSRGQVGGVVNVNGRDVNVSVDTKTAASVASKAYTSGAAGQLAKGAKMDKNGNVIIDPNSAMNAAKTMHAAGATSELAAGMTVSSGGYSTGPAAQSAGATAKKGQYVRAIHDFAGGENGDLPLKQGDRVLIVRKIDENWYEGSFDGKTGIFPAKFVSNA